MQPKIIALIFFAQALCLNAEAQESGETLTLETLVKSSLPKDPDLLAAKKKYESAKAKAVFSWLPDDPEAGVDYEGQSDFLDIDSWTNKEYSVSQDIPFPTKMILRAVQASQEASALYEEYRSEENQAIAAISSPYFELLVLRKKIETLEANSGVLDQMLRASHSRYGADESGREDLLRLDIEKKRMDIELFKARQNESVVQAKISILVKNPLETSYVISEPSKRKATAQDLPSLEKLALENRPELLAIKNVLGRTKTESLQAQTEWLPDLTLRYEGREFRGSGDITEHDSFIGFKVPAWSLLKGIGGSWRSAALEVRSAEHLYESAMNETLIRLRAAWAQLKSAEYALEQYDAALLSSSRQYMDASLISYESGRKSFLNLLDSQRTDFDIRVDYYRHWVDYETAWLEIEALTRRGL
jgi:outer membrane protein, heavy metal efflux system